MAGKTATPPTRLRRATSPCTGEAKGEKHFFRKVQKVGLQALRRFAAAPLAQGQLMETQGGRASERRRPLRRPAEAPLSQERLWMVGKTATPPTRLRRATSPCTGEAKGGKHFFRKVQKVGLQALRRFAAAPLAQGRLMETQGLTQPGCGGIWRRSGPRRHR